MIYDALNLNKVFDRESLPKIGILNIRRQNDSRTGRPPQWWPSANPSTKPTASPSASTKTSDSKKDKFTPKATIQCYKHPMLQ